MRNIYIVRHTESVHHPGGVTFLNEDYFWGNRRVIYINKLEYPTG